MVAAPPSMVGRVGRADEAVPGVERARPGGCPAPPRGPTPRSPRPPPSPAPAAGERPRRRRRGRPGRPTSRKGLRGARPARVRRADADHADRLAGQPGRERGAPARPGAPRGLVPRHGSPHTWSRTPPASPAARPAGRHVGPASRPGRARAPPGSCHELAQGSGARATRFTSHRVGAGHQDQLGVVRALDADAGRPRPETGQAGRPSLPSITRSRHRAGRSRTRVDRDPVGGRGVEQDAEAARRPRRRAPLGRPPSPRAPARPAPRPGDDQPDRPLRHEPHGHRAPAARRWCRRSPRDRAAAGSAAAPGRSRAVRRRGSGTARSGSSRPVTYWRVHSPGVGLGADPAGLPGVGVQRVHELGRRRVGGVEAVHGQTGGDTGDEPGRPRAAAGAAAQRRRAGPSAVG